jgi:hypothetical protein
MSLKLIIAIGIITFWLCFPLPLILMNYNNLLYLDETTTLNLKEPTTFNFLLNFSLWDYVKVYFTIMFLYIPNAPIWLNLFVILLRFISGLIVYALVRGD